MIKFDKNIWFLYYVICFLFIFNLAMSFRIPLVLQISGLIGLCIVPGFLLCLLFRIKVSDFYENFLYSIGLSIIFDLLFGLLINTLLPIFWGINNPLSSHNLQIGFSIIILIFTLLIIYRYNTPTISFKIPKIFKIEKIFLIFGFIILICSQIGVFLVNANSTNLLIIFSIFLIPILLLLLIVYHGNSIKRIYPFIIYLLSFSLLMLLSLRSNYILGVDTHEEYYLFYNTLIQSLWVPDPSLLLSAALSISIFPTVFENFLNIDPQVLFKLLYPILFSITPLIIYVIVKKYYDELLAVFASCFFMFQRSFIITTGNSRTSLAIFFFAFAVLVVCNNELSNAKKYLLILLFIAGTIFSHYTSSLIFLAIIFSAYLMDFVFSRNKNLNEKNLINFPLIIFFLSLFFFWFEQVINRAFTVMFGNMIYRITIFNDLLKNDVSKYVYRPATYTSYLTYFIKSSQVIIIFIVGIGILFAFYNWFLREIQKNSFPKFTVNINRTLFSMGFPAYVLLLCIFFAPFVFFGYDGGRVLGLILVILPVFLIIGATNFFKLVVCEENLYFSKMKFYKKMQPMIGYCKSNQTKIVSGILLILLVPHLLLATNISNEIDGVPYSIIVHSPRDSKDIELSFGYIFDQDAGTLRWFRDNSYKNDKIFSDDYGNSKIISLTTRQSTLQKKSLMELNETDILKGYIFLSIMNKYYNKFENYHDIETDISFFNYILNQKNKIFENGAVLYK